MWEDDLETKARRKVTWLIGIVAAVLVAAGGWTTAGRTGAAAPGPAACTRREHRAAGLEPDSA
jgi:hypothetical protein